MRDLVLTAIVFGSLIYIIRKPYYGVLVWSWLSYMNPHRLTWSFAYSMPFAQIVAIVLFISMLFDKEKKNFPRNRVMFFWIALIAWWCITTAFAIYPDEAAIQLSKCLKIQLVTLVTIVLLNSIERINQLIWVICGSIGFFSVKGGIYTLRTAGGGRVWGPSGSFIADNNALALATLMVVPMMIYLASITRKTWIRYGLYFCIASSLVSALGSQSRGALVALIAVGAFYWLKTRTKILSALLIVLVAALTYNFMPASWHDRMASIRNYEEDGSALGRINAWHYSFHVANDRLTGAGFESWTRETFAIYAPNPTDVHAAHSIYFGILGDHGWVGLGLFVIVIVMSWLNLSHVIRKTKGIEEYRDYNFLCRMLQVSLVAWLSGGAFLSLAYFDLPWHVFAMALLLRQQISSLQESQAQRVTGNEMLSV